MTIKSIALAIGGIVIGVAAACTHENASPPVRIRIAGGLDGATFSLIANALASLYSERLPKVTAEALQTTGTTVNLDAVETGDAECGLGSADLLYNARIRGTARRQSPHTHLSGVAVLFANTVHLTTRANSALKTLPDLAGRRIAGAVPGDVTRGFRMDAIVSVIAQVSKSHLPPSTVVAQIDDAVERLERGDVDAAHFYGGYPFLPVTSAAQRFGIRIIELDDLAVSLVKERSPFSKAVTIPARTYPGQGRPVQTVGIDNVFFCRSDLPPDLVYHLTRMLFDGVPALAEMHASARQINPENGPATPIPLHNGATRYYRERELFR